MPDSTTVKQSAVDTLSLLGPILPMMPTAAMQEVSVQLKNLIDQNAQTLTTNAAAIAQLQADVADLPNLNPAERSEVLNLISQEMNNLNIDPSFVVNYRGDSVDAQVFLQMLADQQAAKPVEVKEVTKSPEGYVTSAKIVFDDAAEQTVTFSRTVDQAGTVATYTGQIPDGVGGLADGYEYRLGIVKFDIPGLTLASSWDGDLISQKLFISNLSLSFVNLTQPGGQNGPGTL